MFVIAHLSDPHLDGTAEPRDRLRRVTSYLLDFARPVDVVLLTGDLADHGTEYAEVAEELAVLGDLPVLVLPGNHDLSGSLRSGLAKYVDSSGHPVHEVRDLGGARFVLLDSTVPGEDHGLLSAESLEWLRGVLAEPVDGPLFVAFHHPPIGLQHPTMDQWLLRDADAFADVIRDRPITALLAGHLHNGLATTFAGHPLLLAPGIRSTVPLPFEPVPSTALVDVTAPPGFALHVVADGSPLITKYRYLP
ncbi:calcineurin-like phosphoesterase family protein [Kribbella amoyensis]|uniref:Calcineurin-like phosphoesterase family protein n=1 Tax=Kribbella amoyensis TaxID=996641 RepID=A0A561BZF4_9ACTN|nr:metallophosphoesterase [Kribbella amoyensis]TWD84241.1 calcineurin-like phosphoesterase family protein [Kribbella amoyensis]